jgi:hypothetical protein
VLPCITDAAAAPALRELLTHPVGLIRRAAVASLGWSGGSDDVPALARLLRDPDGQVRDRARASLAEIGGAAAADALDSALPALDEDERGEALMALAWLGDGRAVDETRRLAHEHLLDQTHSGYEDVRGAWLSVAALIRIGSEQDRDDLIDRLAEEIDHSAGVDPRPCRQMQHAERAMSVLLWHLRRAGYDAKADAVLERLAQGENAMNINLVRIHFGVNAVSIEPLGLRTVARRAMAALTSTPPADRGPWPPPKFGGQPDWVTAPAWPLDPGGRQMTFLAQLPLNGEPSRVAYVFFTDEANNGEALGSGNAVVVQPGLPAHLETLERATGPALYERIDDPGRYRQANTFRIYERFIVLEAGADPQSWEWPALPDRAYPADTHGDWNKLGGTPRWLQGDATPGAEWRFAFQFNASWAGHEFGDVADCYGFVTDDGRGAFAWQCH